jgi:arylsulfatase A
MMFHQPIASLLRASTLRSAHRSLLGLLAAVCALNPPLAQASWQTLHRWTFEHPSPYSDAVGAAHLSPAASGVSLTASGDATLGQAVRIAAGGNLTAPQGTLAAISTNAFELHLWVKRDSASTTCGLLDTLNNTDTGFQLFFQANNTLRLRLDDTAGNTALFDSTNTLGADGLWHEIAVTVNRALPGGLVFRIDGTAEPPLDPAGVPGNLAPSQALFLGNLNGTSPLLGALAWVEIRADLPPVLPTVTISPGTAFSKQPLAVTLTASIPADSIRYTLDGTEPGTNSPAYSPALTIPNSAELRVRAWLDGLAGPIASARYTIATNAPNIVLFVAEDVGAGDLHCYGNPVHSTPHLDALCRAGVRFTQSYCAGPSNAPNQYALLAGRVLPRSGLPGFIAPGSGSGLAAREWTLGEACLKAGYRTAFIGGWHLGDASSSLPHRQGFELFYGLAMPLAGATPTNLRENDLILTNTPVPGALLDAFMTRALAFLDQHANERFLLVLQVPPLPATGSSLGGSYGNRVEALDAAVGQFTARLGQLGLREKTLFLFASDEGPDLTVTLPRGSPGLFRDGRGTTFEGGVRIPAIVSWPGTILPGQVSQAVWWLPDLPPTLCGIAGLPWPADRPMDGTNRAAALTGAALRPEGNERLYFYRMPGTAYVLNALRSGVWKLHRGLVRTDPENTYLTAPLLFDLEKDPSERFAANSSQAALLTQLEAAAAAHLATIAPPFPQLPTTNLPSASLLGIPTGAGAEPPLQIRFLRPGDTLDDYYALAESTNLLAWINWPLTGLTRQIIVQPDGWEQVTLLPPAPASRSPQTFYQVRALLP